MIEVLGSIEVVKEQVIDAIAVEDADARGIVEIGGTDVLLVTVSAAPEVIEVD